MFTYTCTCTYIYTYRYHVDSINISTNKYCICIHIYTRLYVWITLIYMHIYTVYPCKCICRIYLRNYIFFFVFPSKHWHTYMCVQISVQESRLCTWCHDCLPFHKYIYIVRFLVLMRPIEQDYSTLVIRWRICTITFMAVGISHGVFHVLGGFFAVY